MKRFFLFIIMCATCWMSLNAQVRLQVIEPDETRMPLLSRAASIDSRHDSCYIVYANNKELKTLQKLGFRYTLLPETQSKALTMATTLTEMRQWNCYPTYPVYLQLMQDLATRYPSLCRVDTIGTSVQGRLILCLRLTSQVLTDAKKPEFFYSSTIHGDEITGYNLMLHLADTLLSGYGNNPQYTALLDSVQIFINPLANPDGTYYGGNNNVSGARRYNANDVDLNRNYPDPFGTAPSDAQQVENTAMINYILSHHFRISANIHGGSEILNYPWDSFESSERQHPSAAWWAKISKKFIDTLRANSSLTFTDVTQSGYITGGDWYIIPNGRQDWINYTAGSLEMTMEISETKELPVSQLPTYWTGLQHSFVNYIHGIIADTSFASSDTTVGILSPSVVAISVHPNPTNGRIIIAGGNTDIQEPLKLYDIEGRLLQTFPAGTTSIDIKQPAGLYILRQGSRFARIIKQ